MAYSPVPLAVTGGIAEGKSTVLQMLADLGWRTLSADQVAAEVRARPEVQRDLPRTLGLPSLNDRVALREVLATEPALRRALNLQLHQLIWDEILAREPEAVEVPLLVETALTGACERIWVVTCRASEQRRRLLERLGDERAVDQILQAQLPSRAKCAFADAVIRTNSPIESVREIVERLADSARNDLQGRPSPLS